MSSIKAEEGMLCATYNIDNIRENTVLTSVSMRTQCQGSVYTRQYFLHAFLRYHATRATSAKFNGFVSFCEKLEALCWSQA